MKLKTNAEAAEHVYSDSFLQKLGLYVAQIAISPLLLTLRLLIVRNKLHRDSKGLKLNIYDGSATYILYGNHQSVLDPLIICASLPLKTIRQLLPFRFFVDNSYFKGTIKVFLNIMGGFPAHFDHTRAYGLDKARSLLASGQTVVIFPPGMRTRKKIAKSGISVLASEPNTYLIPIYVDWKHRWHCHVHIGSPLKGGAKYSPELLMESVYSLPVNSSQEV